MFRDNGICFFLVNLRMIILKKFQGILSRRIGLVVLLTFILICVSTITRIALLIKSSGGIDITILNLLGIFLIGWFYDIINAIYFCIPLVLYLWLIPQKIFKRSWHLIVLYLYFFLATFILLFTGISEWFFWDEFNVRFNFIAVDYLVYTTEVIGNIRQSYPIEWIITGLVIISFLITYYFAGWIKSSTCEYWNFKERTKWIILYFAILFLSLYGVNSKQHHFSTNMFINELAGNGLYELFAAYRNNELNYDKFYSRIDNDLAFTQFKQLIKTEEANFLSNNQLNIAREIVNEGPEKKLNVVLISVESFDADFMALFGNQQKITPFLDSLSQHCLAFTNLYATGTRTVRGLEALSLCIPPTPGQSIVRRPDNENLFTLGKVFNQKGYESKYIYGGYGYFDNMNYFFSNNGYNVVDRTALDDSEIDYENIWGVADENLFTLAIREIDKSIKDKPVFAHIMTTSNHRPYTYPEGRIDIPSKTSRQGAVKYTDYAIGKFIKEVKYKPWFQNTVFVIVADHCASSAGKMKLPVNKYHIPMLIYAPGIIEPGIMDRLMSQIDIGPTLLGLLNFSYTSKFYGYDMFKLEAGRERAFISTYQNLGYLKDGHLVILLPQLKVEAFSIADKEKPLVEMPNEILVNEAITWYQTSSYAFKHGLMK